VGFDVGEVETSSVVTSAADSGFGPQRNNYLGPPSKGEPTKKKKHENKAESVVRKMVTGRKWRTQQFTV